MKKDPFFTGDKPKAYDAYRSAFQRHYQVYFGTRGYSFEQYESAYRLGYDLAMDPDYIGRYWDEIKSGAQRRWQEKAIGPWDDFANAVLYAWEELTGFMASADEERSKFFQPGFRRHYNTYYASGDLPYEAYEPAYCLGYDLAMDPRFNFHDWFEIEPEAKQRWGELTEKPWAEFANTVRPALETVKRTQQLLKYGEYETAYRRHFQTHYATVGGDTFEAYEPAYRYGYDLAMDGKYVDRNWYAIEKEIQSRWEKRGEKPWKDVEDAAHRAWHEVKDVFGVEDKYDPTFSSLRRRYDQRFIDMGYPSDYEYEPGYRFGYFLAADMRYRDRAWEEVLPKVEVYWQDNPIGELAGFREAARDGWNEVKKELVT